jgi:hypothetical protein
MINKIFLGLNEITLLCFIAIFFILVITIYTVVQKASFFKKTVGSALVAVCVSLLGIIGIVKLFTHDDKTNPASVSDVNKNTDLNFILFPYIVLGVTIVVIMLLKFIFFILGKSGNSDSQKFNNKYLQEVDKKHNSYHSDEI